MIIGIDGTAFSHPQPGGYKTYVTNLLTALQRTPSQHSFRVFLDRQLPPEAFSRLPGGSGIVVSNRIPILRQVLREQVQLPRRAAKERCTVVHFTANTAPVCSPVPSVLTLHDVIALAEPQARFALDGQRLWQWLIARYARYVIPAAAARCRTVVTVSNYEKAEIIRQLRLPPDKIRAIHLAPNPLFRPFSTPERKTTSDQIASTYGVEPSYILSVGHEPRKNVSSVIRAYASLEPSLKKRTSVLIVCARQPAQQALKEVIANLKLDGRVRVIGAVPPEELLRLYNGAAALVFPSLRESFGLPPLEAMACGTPVIASNTSSLPEVLGHAGILVAPTDVAEIAGGIDRVLTNPGFADELRERGLDRAASFSWHKVALQTIEVYEQSVQI